MIALRITINILIYKLIPPSLQMFFLPHFLSFSSRTPVVQMLVLLMVSLGSLRLCSFFFIFLFFCCSDQIISSYLQVLWFFLPLVGICYWVFGEFFISVILLFMSRFLFVSFFWFLSLYWYFLFGETSFSYFPLFFLYYHT